MPSLTYEQIQALASATRVSEVRDICADAGIDISYNDPWSKQQVADLFAEKIVNCAFGYLKRSFGKSGECDWEAEWFCQVGDETPAGIVFSSYDTELDAVKDLIEKTFGFRTGGVA